jgi:NAD(P)H-hydrate epimerase
MVIGGGEDFHGAPALASTAAYNMLAAMRTGAGYVSSFVPKSIIEANRAVSANVIVRPLKGRNLSERDVKDLVNAAAHFDAVAIGNGLGRSAATEKAAAKLIAAISKEKKVVVDADAIYSISSSRAKLGRNVLLTPNEKEFGALCKEKVARTDLNGRVAVALKVSKLLGTNLLLKGHEAVITDGTRVVVVKSGSSSLAVMGTGDVLSGIIAAYAAKNDDLFIAAVAGAYLHSKIGDHLHKQMGDHIVASDVVDAIPLVLKGLE